MGRRNYAHVVEVPFWDYMIRILQTVLALALIIFTAYTVVFKDFKAVRLAVFTVSRYFFLDIAAELKTEISPSVPLRLVCIRSCHLGLLPYRCPRTTVHLQLGRCHRH
jgi:hypothetical protein